jgi:hypothetical protein
MTEEPEVIKARLVELSCPYGPFDERAVAWLEGYQKGYDQATTSALASFERLGAKQ